MDIVNITHPQSLGAGSNSMAHKTHKQRKENDKKINQMKILELKSTITKMKYSLVGFNNGLEWQRLSYLVEKSTDNL